MLIKCDILNIRDTKSLEFASGMIGNQNHDLKHSLSAIISILSSTAEGVKYLTFTDKNDFSLLDKLIENIKRSEDSSTSQRFMVAALQKLSAQSSENQLEESVSEGVIDVLVKSDMLEWALNML